MAARVIESNADLLSRFQELESGDLVVGRVRLRPGEEHLLFDLARRGIRLVPSALSQWLSRSKVVQARILCPCMVPSTRPVYDMHDLMQLVSEYGRDGVGRVVCKLDRANGGIGILLFASVEEVYSQAVLGSVTFTARGAPATDTAIVTALANEFATLIVQDVSSNDFGADTLPILVQQLPWTVLVSPDTVSLLVGGTTTFSAAAVDQGGDTMAVPIHWRPTNEFSPHLTIITPSPANQVTVKLDSTPYGTEYVTAYALRGPGDTVYGFGGVNNPVQIPLDVGGSPYAAAVNQAANRIYVSNTGGTDLTVIFISIK